MAYKIKSRPDSKKDTMLFNPDSKHALEHLYAHIKAEKKLYMYIAFGVLIIVLGVYSMISFRYNLSDAASDMEYKAEQSYEKNKDNPEKITEVLAIYLQIIKKYPSSRSARFARLKIGDIHFERKNYTEAIKAYEGALGSLKKNEMLLSLAYQKLANSYVKADNLQKAKEYFLKVLDIPSANNKDVALMEIARLNEANSDIAGATKNYETIIRDFPKSPLAAAAQAKLDQRRKDTEKDKKEELKQQSREAQ